MGGKLRIDTFGNVLDAFGDFFVGQVVHLVLRGWLVWFKIHKVTHTAIGNRKLFFTLVVRKDAVYQIALVAVLRLEDLDVLRFRLRVYFGIKHLANFSLELVVCH